jgi:hypothetical protein
MALRYLSVLSGSLAIMIWLVLKLQVEEGVVLQVEGG